MKRTAYQNFDLEFYRADGLFHVRARSSAGEAKHSFHLPFTVDDIAHFHLQLEASLDDPHFDNDLIKDFGGKLYDAVFQKEVGALFKSSLALAHAQSNSGLRIRFTPPGCTRSRLVTVGILVRCFDKPISLPRSSNTACALS